MTEPGPSAALFLVVAFATVALLALTEQYGDVLVALVALTAAALIFNAGARHD